MKTNTSDALWVYAATRTAEPVSRVVGKVGAALGVPFLKPVRGDPEEEPFRAQCMGINLSLYVAVDSDAAQFDLRGSLDNGAYDRVITITDFICARLSASTGLKWVVAEMEREDLDARLAIDRSSAPSHEE